MSVSDYLTKMLEMMARALGIALFKLKELKQNGIAEGGFDFIKQNFKEELDIDVDYLLKLEDNNLIDYLISKKFKNKHIELLSEIFYELSETALNKDKINLLQKSKLLLTWAETNDKTFIIHRQNLLKQIDLSLEKINDL